MQHTSPHQLSDDTALEVADTLAARRLYPAEPARVREEWADERDLPLELTGGAPDAILIRLVERFGLPQRLLVAPAAGDDDGAYRLLDDPRWLAAAREAGLRRLPIRVLEVEPAAADLLALVLNQQRPAGVAAQAGALEPLLEAGLTEEEVGRAAGMKKAQVAKLAKLSRLDPVLRQALREGAITPATAHAAAELPDLQPELAEDFEHEGKLTPAQVRRRADEAARAAVRLAEAEAAETSEAVDEAAADGAGSTADPELAEGASDTASAAGTERTPAAGDPAAVEWVRAQARALLLELDQVELPADLGARLAAVLDEIGRAPVVVAVPS